MEESTFNLSPIVLSLHIPGTIGTVAKNGENWMIIREDCVFGCSEDTLIHAMSEDLSVICFQILEYILKDVFPSYISVTNLFPFMKTLVLFILLTTKKLPATEKINYAHFCFSLQDAQGNLFDI